MNIDHRLSKRMFQLTRHSRVLRPLAIFCATSLIFVMATAVAMLFQGADPMAPMMNRWVGGALLLIPLGIVWLFTVMLQLIVRRERPFDDGQGKSLITMVWDGPSFPSAHASLAFALASIATIFAPELFGPWLWVGAVLVAWGRVAVGVHYVTDVLVGALLGAVVGFFSTLGIILLLVSQGVID